MNIPNLPTDNLYKFIALFGLVITISSAYFYTKYYEDSSNKYDMAIYYLEKTSDKNMLLLNSRSIKNEEVQEYLTKLKNEAKTLSRRLTESLAMMGPFLSRIFLMASLRAKIASVTLMKADSYASMASLAAVVRRLALLLH